MGIAWVSGDGGTRGYWTEGRHVDSFDNVTRRATPLDPIPYGGGGLPASVTGDATGRFEHNAWRPVGENAPAGDPRYARGELLLATEEDFGPAEEACSKRGQFTIASLAGSFDGDAWRLIISARRAARSSRHRRRSASGNSWRAWRRSTSRTPAPPGSASCRRLSGRVPAAPGRRPGAAGARPCMTGGERRVRKFSPPFIHA